MFQKVPGTVRVSSAIEPVGQTRPWCRRMTRFARFARFASCKVRQLERTADRAFSFQNLLFFLSITSRTVPTAPYIPSLLELFFQLTHLSLEVT